MSQPDDITIEGMFRDQAETALPRIQRTPRQRPPLATPRHARTVSADGRPTGMAAMQEIHGNRPHASHSPATSSPPPLYRLARKRPTRCHDVFRGRLDAQDTIRDTAESHGWRCIRWGNPDAFSRDGHTITGPIQTRIPRDTYAPSTLKSTASKLPSRNVLGHVITQLTQEGAQWRARRVKITPGSILDIWGDDDWLDLTPPAQHLLFCALDDTPQLSYCGTGEWVPAKIATKARGWKPDEVEEAGEELSANLFLIVDTVTVEFILRSWMKHDGLWAHPQHGGCRWPTRARSGIPEPCRWRHRARGEKASRSGTGFVSWQRDAVAKMLTQKAIDPDDSGAVCVAVNPTHNPWPNPVRQHLGCNPLL